MPARNTRERYGSVARTLHWAIFVLFVAQFSIAWYMEPLPLGLEKQWYYNLHKSIGLVVLILVLVRIWWRHVSPPPPLPSHMARWEVVASKASHHTLYALMLIQPISGLVYSDATGFPSIIFGLFTLPHLIGDNEPVKNVFGAIHFYASWTILLVVAIHVAAALRHHFILRDDILRRMLPGV